MNSEEGICGKHKPRTWLKSLIVAGLLLVVGRSYGEVCTTQSQMKPEDRGSIANAALAFASRVQANDVAGLLQKSLPEFAKDSTAVSATIGSTAPKIASDVLIVEQVYILDATNLKASGPDSKQEAQFFCSLNNSIAETTFLIPSLPPGRYAFAQVIAQGAKSRWGLSFLLRQEGADRWALAGFYPKSLTAAGHDGLWYWTQARSEAKAGHLWTAYLFYQEAQNLLQPTGFVGSTHLEKLQKEQNAATPPALSDGISPTAPLVIKGQNGSEYRLTGMSTDDSIGGDQLYVVIHLAPDPEAELSPDSTAAGAKPATQRATPVSTVPASPKDRNLNAMSNLLAAYPELRANFGGVWVFADAPGKNSFVTEQPMAEIH